MNSHGNTESFDFNKMKIIFYKFTIKEINQISDNLN